MEKVSEKWFKDNGWSEYKTEPEISHDGSTIVTRKSVSYSLYGKPSIYKCKTWARWEHVITIWEYKWGGKKISNWYSFSCFGKIWNIENRFSHRRFTVEQVMAALTIVGLNNKNNVYTGK